MSELYPVCRVISSGVGLSIQDSGRPGWRRFGLPASGAMDAYSMVWANRLVGNSDWSPVLEFAFQGVKLEFLADSWIACCGARTEGDLDPWSGRFVEQGEILSFRRCVGGVFTYLAISGGWASDLWFGSCSANPRARIGGLIKVEDILYSQRKPNVGLFPGVSKRVVLKESKRDYCNDVMIRIFRGPQYEFFNREQVGEFVSKEWRVSSRSDRTGYRLEGGTLYTDKTISSEPTLPGSVQVTPSGQPIVTLNDGPTVGGYPKIAFVHPGDLSWLVQTSPNQNMRFQWVD
ncbi:biotin-dependent carboxyltransferase family protein [Puniceicoccaceae bacterium K14]|nr:biotin-dependent carboxyltransferase family protein [Puniceicoccaceae bacterium K14]